MIQSFIERAGISIVMTFLAGFILTGCFADKAILGIDIDQSRKITGELTEPVALQGKVPDNLNKLDKNVLLIYAITGNIQEHGSDALNYANNGYTLKNVAEYSCKSARRDFSKIYRYSFAFSRDGKSIQVINNSDCPICYNSGRIEPLSARVAVRRHARSTPRQGKKLSKRSI